MWHTGHLAAIDRGAALIVTRSGVGITCVTESDCGIKESRLRDIGADHGRDSMSLHDSAPQYKPGTTKIAGEPNFIRH